MQHPPRTFSERLKAEPLRFIPINQTPGRGPFTRDDGGVGHGRPACSTQVNAVPARGSITPAKVGNAIVFNTDHGWTYDAVQQ